jgi:hypothetical protein
MSPALVLILGLVIAGFGIAILASPRLASSVLAYNRRKTERYGAAAGPGAQTPLQVKAVGAVAVVIGAVLLVVGVVTL